MLDLTQLRYFAAVAETQNVGEAAKRLNITQSPLSRQIQNLEAQLGIQLFERKRKRLYLTSSGRDFLVVAKDLLGHASRAEAHAESIAKGDEGTLVVGYVEGAIHAGVLPAALRKFSKRAPKAKFDLRAIRSREQHRQLEAQEIDLGFSYAGPPDGTSLTARRIHRERFLLAAPRGFVKGGKRVTAAQLDHQPFVSLPLATAPGARHALVEACENAGFAPSIQHEAAEPTMVLGFVSAGLGLAIVQSSLQKSAPRGVVFLDLPPRFSLRLSLYLVSREAPSPLVQTFLEAAY